MKVLRVKDNQGFFATEKDDFKPIDKISKENLLKLIDLALEQDVELDEYNDLKIRNQAHQIIYKSIYEKLLELKNRKNEFKDKSERLFLSEYERYKSTSE